MIAVQGSNIKDAGAIVWWALRGGLDVAALATEWRARIDVGEPLEEGWLPQLPSRRVAIQRAVTDLAAPGILVRPVKAGWGIVEERLQEDGTTLRHAQTVTFTYDKVLRVKCSVPGHAYEARVEEQIEHYSRHLEVHDVSRWMSNMMDRLQGVPLRESGGVYFVPAYSRAALDALVGALGAAAPANRVYRVAAVQDEEAVRAFLDAVATSIAAEVARTREELGRADMGAKALETRMRVAAEARAKLDAYENLLGTRLDEIHAELAELTNAIVNAHARATAEGAAQ